MKFAIVGASGEIGARLAQQLLTEGEHKVLLLSRKKSPRLAKWGNINFMSISIDDVQALTTALSGVDVVVNCAIDKTISLSENQLVEKNKAILSNLLICAENAGVKKFIELSSIAVLPPQVTSETLKAPYNYSTETDWYTKSKIATDLLAAQYVPKSNMELCVVRAGIVYGPYMHWSVMSLNRLLNYTIALPPTNSVCHAIHVDDLCALLIHLATIEQSLPRLVYGINPESLSWEQFYKQHGISASMPMPLILKMETNALLAMIEVQGDRLRLPSKKRKLIDVLRKIYTGLPQTFKQSQAVLKLVYTLKAFNYGLINYAAHLSPSHVKAKKIFYPNRFELQLYQTNAAPLPEDCGIALGFSYKHSFEKGTCGVGSWWNFDHD